MNYRHAYHAGNFADVLKHVIVALVITYMKRKPQPFRVIDTHAGRGVYDLTGTEAGKTCEWKDGIGRLMTAALSDAASALLAPYFDALQIPQGSEPDTYPGSPLIARRLMRHSDVLIANELHPDEADVLDAALARQPNTRVTRLDAYTAIKSLLPPKERRGVILIDPPFESGDEFERVVAAIADGLARFETGTFVVWYPAKDPLRVDTFRGLVARNLRRTALDVSLKICAAAPGLGLTETGVIVINPPYTLVSELEVVMPELVRVLGDGGGASYRISALVDAG